MESASRVRVLIVANRTAGAPRLLHEVRRRAEQGLCEFTPDPGCRRSQGRRLDAGGGAAAAAPSGRAARRQSRGRTGSGRRRSGGRPRRGLNEIIVSTLPKKTSHWLRRDLIRRIERLGLPVTAIVPGARELTKEEIGEYVGRFSAGGG